MVRFIIGFILGFNVFPILMVVARGWVAYSRRKGGDGLDIDTRERRQMWIREGV